MIYIYFISQMVQIYQRLTSSLVRLLGEEGSDGALDQSSADGTFPQRGSTLLTDHQVTTRDEDNVHLLVHTHLTGPLLLQAP